MCLCSYLAFVFLETSFILIGEISSAVVHSVGETKNFHTYPRISKDAVLRQLRTLPAGFL